MIPSAGSCGHTSSPVELLDSSCHVSTDVLPLMSSAPSSDADAHSSSLGKPITTDAVPLTPASNENMSTELDSVSTLSVHEDRQDYTRVSPKTRIRRTQVKMLADNLSKFYAPAAGGKRRELLAQKRTAVDVHRSARERQLEVIRKQVSLVETRKKFELEMAAEACQSSNMSEPDKRSVHTADGVIADSVLKPKSPTARFSARQSRKLERLKTKYSKFAIQHKEKLPRAHNHEAESSSSLESTWLTDS